MEFETIKTKEYINLYENEIEDFKLLINLNDLIKIDSKHDELYCIKKIRISQQTFREGLIDRYKKCIITETIKDECEAAHIIAVSDFNKQDYNIDTYDINNGLLLSANLHKTFDKYLWSINPDTFIIEISSLYDCGTITNYNNISLADKLSKYNYYESLSNHYKKFKENC